MRDGENDWIFYRFGIRLISFSFKHRIYWYQAIACDDLSMDQKVFDHSLLLFHSNIPVRKILQHEPHNAQPFSVANDHFAQGTYFTTNQS